MILRTSQGYRKVGFGGSSGPRCPSSWRCWRCSVRRVFWSQTAARQPTRSTFRSHPSCTMFADHRLSKRRRLSRIEHKCAPYRPTTEWFHFEASEAPSRAENTNLKREKQFYFANTDRFARAALWCYLFWSPQKCHWKGLPTCSYYELNFVSYVAPERRSCFCFVEIISIIL